jgi:phosphoglycerate dehydrogenase-like enzyme/glyoxylase-like metal-dependent hydrolase (beta-lactamase superfamily II)
MRAAPTLGWLALACLVATARPLPAEPPKMKFNEVKEVAPGVFFRYSVISATDPNVFGGCNNIWVVFGDYVVVIDANFPKEARDVVAAVKKTTDKPIRYVFDTHHHGDHAWGNAVFAELGAGVIAQVNCARILRVDGPKEFAAAGRGPMGRKDVAASRLQVPNVVFDDKLVLDDGTQRIEFLFLGHGHTAGDAVAYLPKHKILCTGDACVNGAFNYMGQSDSASWIRALEKMQQLDVQSVCPGHGPPADRELLEKQKRYFVELRQQVKKGIDARRDFADIAKGIDMPWYKEWTGVPPTGANVRFVYDELTGRVAPWDLAEDFGVLEGPSPTKKTPGWRPPKAVVVPAGLPPAQLEELKAVAPQVSFLPARTAADAARLAAEADAVLGLATPEVLRAGKGLRWVQVEAGGADGELLKALRDSKAVATNTDGASGPQAADQAFALLLALTRGVAPPGKAGGVTAEAWERLRREARPQELHGKTMLVVGLGGLGAQVARRAHAFGMRVRAIDARDLERPACVFSLDKPAKLMELLPAADVVVLACPLTDDTRGLIGAKQLEAMKKSAYLINVARGELVDTPALAEALAQKRLAGAGLDAVAPEPPPADSPLWSLPNVVLSPHVADRSPEGRARRWRLYRENVRRFAAGEPLLCVIDKGRGGLRR